MEKRKLKDVTDYSIFSHREAVKALNWTVTDTDDGESYTVTCDCGNSKIRYIGFLGGVEEVRCDNCGKHMLDLFSPIPIESGQCGLLHYSDFDIEKDENGDERIWIAGYRHGWIKALDN